MHESSKIETIKKAYKIAVNDLKSNYGHLGIYAGPRNHHEYWARDAFFASLGALSIGDNQIVKQNLDTFTKFQTNMGHVPLRVEERLHQLGVVGINIKHNNPKAIYLPTQPWADEVIDSNPLYLIAVAEYAKATGDRNWVLKNKDKIMNAVNWLVGKFNERNLVTEGFNAGWADFTFKRGNVLYTNIIVWQAFKSLCEVLPADGANFCLILTGQMKKAIEDNLWDEKRGYFIDHIGKHGKKHNVFAADGNLLAIFYGFVDEAKGRSIMNFVDKNNLNKVPVPIYFPHLEWKHKILNNIFFTSYNTENTFTWWGSVSAICRIRLGDNQGALEDLFALGQIILRYKAVPEIVNPKGEAVRSLFYRTEMHSSWAAGMYVFAYGYAKKRGIAG